MTDRSRPPLLRPFGAFSFPEPECEHLGAGVPLYILRGGKEDVVRLDLVFRGGRYQQAMPLQAVFAVRMLREGAVGLSASAIEQRLDYYGSWLETSAGPEHTFLTVYAPGRFFPEVLPLVEDLVKCPTFPSAELDVVVAGSRQQFLLNLRKGAFVARRYLRYALLGGAHPGGRLLMPSDYARLTSACLADFHRACYGTAGCSVFLSGRITDAVRDSVGQAFGSSPWGASASLSPFGPYPAQGGGERRLFVLRPQARQHSIGMGELTIPPSHPDFPALQVLVTLLGGYFGSRLMSRIREELGYTYGISAALQPIPEASLFVVATETDGAYTEAVVAEVYAAMERLQAEPVAEAELAVVRNYLYGQLCRSFEGVFALADAWIDISTGHLPPDHYHRQWDVLAALTPERLREVACRYLHPHGMTEVVVGAKNANKP